MAGDVGFVGLGQMGLPMVANLSGAGFSVSACDLKAEVCAAAGALDGVVVAASPAEVAARAPVVFTCLPSASAVEAVYTGVDGVASAGPAGLVTCDCSTAAPEVSRSLARRLAERGIRHLEAPIFGVPPQAEEGDLFFAVAGEEACVAAVAPFLEAMGRGWRYVGGAGVAHTMKILQNGLGMGHAALAAEVLAVCERLELDTDAFIGLVREARALGLSVLFERYAEALAGGGKTNAGLLPVAAKDTGLAGDLARRAGLRAPILEETAAAFREAMDNGWAGEEFTVVSRIARERRADGGS